MHLPDDCIYFGGDYNPEQWDEAIWQDDVRRMKEAGVNLATLGVFAWASLETRPGDYDFGWLDRIIHLLDANGIGVCLATATASPPPWLARLHPASLPVTADGVVLHPGGRQHYCPHSADYRRHAAALVEQIARRYGAHPAVRLWHINNEYACHVPECFCETSARAFRAWLRQKYGSIDSLNRAWGTAFWSQRYSDWDEIHPPRRAPTFCNPTQQLDWKRFCSDSLLELFAMEKTILRAHSSLPITTNFMGYFKPLNYWQWAASEDIVSLDCYPDPASPNAALDLALNADLMRSLKGGAPWILMEQAPAAVNWRPVNVPKAPGQMRLLSLTALARGANGVLFFQWRQSAFGAEKFHSALLPHGGAETRTFREACQLGRDLRQLTRLASAPVAAEVAILWDWENWWALELDSKPAKLFWPERLVAHYAPLFAANIPVDFAHPSADLSRYKLVIAPSLYLTRTTEAENLTRYVENGGALLVSFFSGMVDENEHIHPGGYPAPLRRVLGLRIDEFAPLASDHTAAIDYAGQALASDLWCDVITLEGAEPVATFVDGFAAGRPAITRHSFGKGLAWYIGARPEAAALHKLYAQILAEMAIWPALMAPPGVEVVRRGQALFVLNHNRQPVAVDLGEWAGQDLLSGATIAGSARLDAYGCLIMAPGNST